MKKIYTLLSFILFSIGLTSAQCTIDSSNTKFFSPPVDSLPCVERTVSYNQIVLIAVPDSIHLAQLGISLPYAFKVDSVVIDSVTGFPTGITDSLNPANGRFYGNSHACALISGTTSDTTGTYHITFHGTITLAGYIPFFFNGDTTLDLATSQSSPLNPFNSSIIVIAPGDSCRSQHIASGTKDFSSALNTAIYVYPNPSNGVFGLQLNTGGRVTGEIVVIDVTGRMVYSQKLDLMGLYNTSIDLSKFSKGLYTLQLRTTEGVASKSVSIE